MSVNSTPSIDLQADHQHHAMNHDMSKQPAISEVSSQNMSNDMNCCDDCVCDYAHCHNPLLLTFNASTFDFNVTNNLNFIAHVINDKNLPSLPYRPPIV